MSKALRTIALAGGTALALVACTAPNSATGDTQKMQANTLFMNPVRGRWWGRRRNDVTRDVLLFLFALGDGNRGSASSRAPVLVLKPALAAAVSRVWVLRRFMYKFAS